MTPKRVAIVVNVLAPAGTSAARVSRLHLTEAVVETVKAGLGITVMARWAVAPQLREKTLRAVPVTRAGLVRRWWTAIPRGHRKRPGVEELVKILREGGLD